MLTLRLFLCLGFEREKVESLGLPLNKGKYRKSDLLLGESESIVELSRMFALADLTQPLACFIVCADESMYRKWIGKGFYCLVGTIHPSQATYSRYLSLLATDIARTGPYLPPGAA